MNRPTVEGGAGTRDPATEPKQPDKSLGELLGDMSAELSELFRKELELAKTETREQVAKVGRASGMFAGATLGGWLALLFLSFALAWALDQAMNRAVAFLIVGAAWAVVGVALLMRARTEAKSIRAMPVTTQTLKEDVQWARTQKP